MGKSKSVPPRVAKPSPKAKTLRRPPPGTLSEALSAYGTETKKKLSNPGATGQPEDQLRSPVEELIGDLAILGGIKDDIVAVGESGLTELKTRPDFAITRGGLLTGFVELKAPGKGADPRRFRERHDKEQWQRLQSLPNLVYSDGNAFSLWRYGELVGRIVELAGDVATSGAAMEGTDALTALVHDFLSWAPIVPRDAKQLAELTAKLCRLLRDEVTEQLAVRNPTLKALAEDWRKVLFPDATDKQFADGYAQAVTFGMLMAKAEGITLAKGLDQTGQKLGSTLIGTALRVLTFTPKGSKLTTSIDTLIRVLDAVYWPAISKGDPDAWLYFYENFLAVYDNELRKQTGSYYTPAQVVNEMVRLVDEVLRTRFALRDGLASSAVTLVDPAAGTGTFLLGVLHKIASIVELDQGAGAVAGAIDAAVRRLIAFEIQLGPFAVAQVRLRGELEALIGDTPSTSPRMFVTDTLANPYVEQEWLPQMLEPIAESRRQANQIKKQERIMVVLGNPPYKEKAKGRGGWIEEGSDDAVPPLDNWMPPVDWKVGAHSKHLRNLYVYFWRWATWKVFDQDPTENTGVVCFITVAGFINGPGFQKMRDYLRRTTDEIWVIDCTPEGLQPEVNTRIFEGVQRPVCIVLASRSPSTDPEVPATVRYRALPENQRRSVKFTALAEIGLSDEGWAECFTGWRDPFLPASAGAWSTYPALDDFFVYAGMGVMPGRTWVIAPDAESLIERWKTLISANPDAKERLFHPHLRQGKPGDKHTKKIVKSLPGFERGAVAVADDRRPCLQPIQYAFRSFDRQWIIPDNRLINQPNPQIWHAHSEHQVYLTALVRHPPTSGPALTCTGLVPDHDHYNGRAGRALPLWLDQEGKISNLRPSLLRELGQRYGYEVTAEDVFAYIVGVAGHPDFTCRFQGELRTPGLRIPITADPELFREAVGVGRHIVWLHTFGQRFMDPKEGRKKQAPRLAKASAPNIPRDGAISMTADEMPDEIHYDDRLRRLKVGSGFIDNVSPEIWNYEVSGKSVIRQWFSYRKANRERPIIGDRRPPSPLGDIQPEQWLAEYTTELLDVINVLGRLIDLQAAQRDLLDRICSRNTIRVETLRTSGALTISDGYPKKPTAALDFVPTNTGEQLVLEFGRTKPKK